MLYGKDPKTDKRLPEDTIINNMITFLVAGHEITSGMLSFTSYFLTQHPEAFQEGQEEVDRVVGKGPVKFERMSKLPYIEAVLRESLRLWPIAPAFTLKPETRTGPIVLVGQYYIPSNADITILIPQIGRDPKAHSPDADEFKPERVLGENFETLPPHCWKPFGNGKRSCIGRPFAWQEAVLILALILLWKTSPKTSRLF